MLNADFARRGAVGDEAIEVLRTLWREPAASYAGELYHLEEAVFYPKPLRGTVPIWIGGNSPAAMRRAARYGEAWSPYGIGLEAFQAGVAALRAEMQGRALPLLAAHLMLHLGPAPRGHVHGTPEQVVQVLSQYQQAGLSYLICGFEADSLDGFLGQVQRFAEAVMPHLR
jgi:alkanesulfonate monooxygenase SsuD/methylene tetrahydromethanopterin reductase-like flavin-dependent oxidoreductase (luciferase family)